MVDRLYRGIHSEYDKEQKENALNKRKALVESHELQFPVTALSFSSAADTIKTDPNQLKAYLQNLIQLETNIIALPKYLEKLYYQYSMTQTKARSLDSEQVAEQYKKYIECMDRVASCKIAYENPMYPPCPTVPSEPEYQKPGLFNKKKIEAENKALENNYRAQMNAYEQSLRQYEQTVAAIQADAKDKYRVAVYEAKEAKTSMENFRLTMRSVSSGSSLENATHQMLGTEIKRVEELLRKTYQARSEMYALNVVFGKYRDLVAVSTFFEYLMAGRCTSLEGANGAYNLYESEVRANLIIDKLSDVVKKLDKIQQTQYTICSQLRTMNSTLDSLSRTMDTACGAILEMNKSVSRIAENTDVIAYNTAATAYYAKVNAELTNAMGYMMAYKL